MGDWQLVSFAVSGTCNDLNLDLMSANKHLHFNLMRLIRLIDLEGLQ